MRKTFVSNLVLLLALNLLVKPFYVLGVEAEIQNRVGADVFGSYFALINFSFLLNILPDLGTTNWNTRNIAQHRFLFQKQFPKIITLRLLLALIYFIVVAISGMSLKYTTGQMLVLSVLSLNQVIQLSILYLRSNLAGMHLFRQDSFISVLDRVILTLHMSLLLWGGWGSSGTFRISWLIWGQTFSLSVSLIVAFIFVFRKTKNFRLWLDIPFSRALLKQSFPYALLIFVSMIAYRIDSVMLERISGATEAGIYAMGFRFFEAFNMIAYLFAVLLLPIFSGMIRRGEEISPLLILASKLMLVGAWIICITCVFWSREIISLFYDHHTSEAADAFTLLMIGCAGFSLQYIFGTLLTARGNMRPMIYVVGAGMLINILLNGLLIPQWGAWGAALSNAITQCLILAGQVILVLKIFRIKTGFVPLQMTLFTTGVALIAGMIYHSPAINSGHLTYSIAVFIAASLVLALLTRMLDLKRFIQLVRSGE